MTDSRLPAPVCHVVPLVYDICQAQRGGDDTMTVKPPRKPPSPPRGRRSRGRTATRRRKWRVVQNTIRHIISLLHRNAQYGAAWLIVLGVLLRSMVTTVCQTLQRLATALWPQIESWLCWFCIWSGATLFIHVQLWVYTNTGYRIIDFWYPSLQPPSIFTDVTDLHGWSRAAVIGALVALVVFAKQGYHEWQTSDNPLMARMLCAGAAGVQGALPLLRRWFQRPHST